MSVDESPAPDYTRLPPMALPPRYPDPPLVAPPASETAPPVTAAEPATTQELSAAERETVLEVQDRAATRLSVHNIEYTPADRRERAKQLLADEYTQMLSRWVHHGLPVPAEDRERLILAAALANMDGLGRLAPLLARTDVEDIHITGCDPVEMRLRDGRIITGPPIADTDGGVVELLRAIAGRSDDGSSREFNTASPSLSLHLKGATQLGARLEATMDVSARPAAVIRIHHSDDLSMDDLVRGAMLSPHLAAFLGAAMRAGLSILILGRPGVGKTSLMRVLATAIPYESVIVTVESEYELGLHLPRIDPATGKAEKKHAVCHPLEARPANSQGQGKFTMRKALNIASRWSPEYLFLGEVRGSYVNDLLKAASDDLAAIVCTIHSKTHRNLFSKVLTNALEPQPGQTPPTPELVMRNLSGMDLVIDVTRDKLWNRYVSYVHEIGEPGDNGRPDMTPVFAPGEDGRAVPQGRGKLSAELQERLADEGFDLSLLEPGPSSWQPKRRGGGW